MDGKQTLKYLGFYQVLATLSALVGLALVGLGVQMGFGDSIAIVMQDAPKNWGDAVGAADPGTFAAMAVLGVLVWQLGKAAALVVTMGKVADAAATGGGASDAEQVRSAVMSEVDERIAPLESDVKDHERKLSAATTGGGAESGGRSGSGSESGGTSGSGSESARAGDGSAASAGGGSAGGSDGGRQSRRRGAGSSDDGASSNRRATPGDSGGDADGGDGS